MTDAQVSQSAHAVQPLQGETLLAAWENGSRQPSSLRAMALLAAGCGLDQAEAIALSIPARDAALLALRQRSFGDTLQAFAHCQACDERLEFSLAAADIARQLDAAAASPTTLWHDGWSLQCRFSTHADIAAAAAEPELAEARRVLLSRCVSAVGVDGHCVSLAELPADVLIAADAHLVAMHDAAELAITLTCPACETRQDVAVDLGAFLWAEARHASHRLLNDVHELAWAYGWSEGAILRMSQPRRAAYLGMVRS